jgi:hypothetical protein
MPTNIATFILLFVCLSVYPPTADKTTGEIKRQIKYVPRLTQLYVYFIIILLLATSFGLRMPLSGQYLQTKN